MTILCIETSTSVCSAAVCKDGEPISQCISKEGSNHARLLPLYIQQLLSEVRQKGLTIDAVAFSEGPGSYTGLRIGAATAKGLCYGLNVPLIPVPTLRVLCQAVKKEGYLLPMIDARRMEVYTLTEEGKACAVVVESEESFNIPPSPSDVYYFGDGAAKCQAVLTKPNWHFVSEIVPEAQYMARLVETRAAKGEWLQANEIAYYEPYYLKEFIAAPSHVKGLQ